jgi:hypothetical protein
VTTPDKRLGAAILDVLTSISATNLARGTTGSVNVPRVDINRLRDAFEEIYPGAIQRCRELQAHWRHGDETQEGHAEAGQG